MQKTKDFGQYYLKKNNDQSFYDPFLYTTKQVEEEILQMQQEGIFSIGLANLFGIILTAPLQTIVTSLQLSIKPHKQIFQPPTSKSTQLAKTNTSLTLQQKRKLELMLRTGHNQKPYTAPVYDGYIGAVKGLMNQGFKAFYKGLFFRSFHQLSHIYCFTQIALLGQYTTNVVQKQLNFISNIFKLYALQTICDISFNVLYIAENRYILQNNIPEFRVFRNVNKVLSKMYIRKEIFRGFSYHFYNNIGEILIKAPLLFSLASNNFHQGLLLAYYCSELIMYPISTAFKRLICQHKDIPGMIPMRYNSIGHAIKLMFNEQGIIGLYRGFGLHQINILVKLGVIGTLIPFLNNLQRIN